MTIKGKAYIVGAFEHPTRKATDKSVAQLHAECARGAIEDAGLKKEDIDGYFCAGDAPGMGAISMVNYMGLKLRHMDSTDTGGSSYIVRVGHAAEAIRVRAIGGTAAIRDPVAAACAQNRLDSGDEAACGPLHDHASIGPPLMRVRLAIGDHRHAFSIGHQPSSRIPP